MLIGERIRQIRELKNMSQGDVEARTKLLRCYTSRVENGHTVPSVETLEKYAHAFGVPIWNLFADEMTSKNGHIQPLSVTTQGYTEDKDLRYLARLMPRIEKHDRTILLRFASSLARGRRK